MHDGDITTVCRYDRLSFSLSRGTVHALECGVKVAEERWKPNDTATQGKPYHNDWLLLSMV